MSVDIPDGHRLGQNHRSGYRFTQPSAHRRIDAAHAVNVDIATPYVSIGFDIYSAAGALIRSDVFLAEGTHRPPGRFTYRWAGRNHLGEPTAAGVEHHYTATVSVPGGFFVGSSGRRADVNRDEGYTTNSGVQVYGRRDVFTQWVPRPDAPTPDEEPEELGGLLKAAIALLAVAGVAAAT